jgi:hypothetical protein
MNDHFSDQALSEDYYIEPTEKNVLRDIKELMDEEEEHFMGLFLKSLPDEMYCKRYYKDGYLDYIKLQLKGKK